MTIEYRKRITRAMLRAEPDKLFVFGDNLMRSGLGGQAKEMRGEPNAFGIPTKNSPSTRPSAYFSDLPAEIAHVRNDLHKLAFHAAQGKVIVWPEDGIGTGLAELPKRAPKTFELIEFFRKGL